jgi:hypothetical protein
MTGLTEEARQKAEWVVNKPEEWQNDPAYSIIDAWAHRVLAVCADLDASAAQVVELRAYYEADVEESRAVWRGDKAAAAAWRDKRAKAHAVLSAAGTEPTVWPPQETESLPFDPPGPRRVLQSNSRTEALVAEAIEEHLYREDG